MQNRPLTRLMVWLCAAVIGLNGTVLACGGLVQCTDADGGARLEWLCAKDTAGHCERACEPVGDSDHSEDGSLPCDDRPVQGDITVADRSASKQGVSLIPPAAFVGFVAMPTTVAMAGAVVAPFATAGRPPPALAPLRTIVLVR